MKDFAYSRTRTVTRKQTVLAAFDALISGLIMVWFIALTFMVMWLIFGK